MIKAKSFVGVFITTGALLGSILGSSAFAASGGSRPHSWSTSFVLPNSAQIRRALKNPHLTVQQRWELESTPTHGKLTVTQTGMANGDPVDNIKAVMEGNYGWAYTWQENIGYNSSGGKITGVSTPNAGGTNTASDWKLASGPSYQFPYDPVGASEFQTNYYATFKGGISPTYTNKDHIAATYQADGAFKFSLYVNGTYGGGSDCTANTTCTVYEPVNP